jgi:MFS family permease
MRPGFYKWFVVGLLWFVCLLNYADRQAIRGVFKPIQEEMGLSKAELGWIGSSFMWVYAIASPFAGLVGDRVRRKTLILVGLAFWSLVIFATGLANCYWQLLLFCALEGLGEAFYFPAAMSLVSDYHDATTRSRAMSIHQSSVYAGLILGVTLAGYLAETKGWQSEIPGAAFLSDLVTRYRWRSGFFVFGTLGVLLAGVLALLLREPRRSQSESSGEHPSAHDGLTVKAGLSTEVLEIFRTRMVLVLIAVFVGANLVANIFMVWMPTYIREQFPELGLAMAGFNGTFWIQIASMVGVIVGGWLADLLIRKHPGGRMITQALGLFLGIPFLFITGWTPSLWVLTGAMIGFGFCKGIYEANIWASLYDVVKPERRATAVGFMNSIGWLGAAIGPIVVGILADQGGFSFCLSATAAIYLFFGLLMIWGVWKYMRPVPASVPVRTAAMAEK